MITRRGMLKGSMGAAVGTVYGGTLISFLTGCGSDNDSDEKVEVLPGGLMVVNPVICVSCRRCEIACGWNHEGDCSPTLARVKVEHNMNYGPHGVQFNYTEQRGECGDRTVVPATCRHCEVCTQVCPQQAISTHPETGAKVIDEKRCVGCGYCADKCPQQVIKVVRSKMKAVKCDLCQGEPACAQVCPTGAIKFYTREQAEAALEQYEKYTGLIG
ncbi:4Fe-4S dicluster domain-containing protein [Shewanella algae]|uniref:4Fe-4S dicluster domain-containing protein n=1 Tax=Shewanella algae TaxID=38313 RepID=UPI001AADD967|nr:4Fe-4S dicluster domain-containing protein [Shewanella algae]MBO2578456.1 4Fe-4S dicluster domain-containing protein [Shewanella algae]MBO2683942.1 4Fe-4S dicluster domain-containing protein [Shewanella algae]BCV61667.1 4Fe-4S ferredoxin [Shewanella algae]